MTRKYLHPVHGWVPYGDGGGGPVEKIELDASLGVASTAAVVKIDDRLWDFVTPVAAGSNLSGAFRNMSSITTVPWFDTSSVTTMSNMFRDCSSLLTAPMIDTSGATDVSDMFRNCGALIEVPALDTSNVTSMSNMFDSCSSLKEIPELDMSRVTTSHSWSNNPFGQLNSATAPSRLSSLTRFRAFGATRTFGVRGALLDTTALNELMTNLGSAINASQTIDIRDNPGSATCDPSIATSKGWNVITA